MLGIALVAYQGFQKHRITFSRDLLGAIVFAFIFSFICFVAADYNHTDDYSYVTYFVSFLRGWEVHMWFVMLFAHFTVRRH